MHVVLIARYNTSSLRRVIQTVRSRIELARSMEGGRGGRARGRGRSRIRPPHEETLTKLGVGTRTESAEGKEGVTGNVSGYKFSGVLNFRRCGGSRVCANKINDSCHVEFKWHIRWNFWEATGKTSFQGAKLDWCCVC